LTKINDWEDEDELRDYGLSQGLYRSATPSRLTSESYRVLEYCIWLPLNVMFTLFLSLYDK